MFDLIKKDNRTRKMLIELILLLLLTGSTDARQSFCNHNTCGKCEKIAYGKSAIARKCHRLLRIPNCCEMYEFGVNGAFLAGDAEPDPRLCAAEPDRVDFDNGCQFCRLHENPRGRPVEDIDDYDALELDLDGVENIPDDALCPMDAISLNNAMVASIVAPVVVFILISALTAAYLCMRRRMRERAEVSKSKRKQESVLRKMSITMIHKITNMGQKQPSLSRNSKCDELIQNRQTE